MILSGAREEGDCLSGKGGEGNPLLGKVQEARVGLAGLVGVCGKDRRGRDFAKLLLLPGHEFVLSFSCRDLLLSGKQVQSGPSRVPGWVGG